MKKIYGDISGGLGNLLFDCTHLYTFGKKLNIPVEYHLRSSLVFKRDPSRGTQLDEYIRNKYERVFRNFNINLNEITLPYPSCEIKYFFQNYINYVNNEYIILRGCYPTFEDFEQKEIQEMFSIDDETKKEIEDKYSNLLNLPNKVSLNVRRGDFLRIPSLTNLLDDTDYYIKAMELCPENSNFIVISDNINDCKKVLKGKNIFFLEKSTPLQDFYFQTYCRINICANSTFSYWAAYLNKTEGQIIIKPKCRNSNLIKDIKKNTKTITL